METSKQQLTEEMEIKALGLTFLEEILIINEVRYYQGNVTGSVKIEKDILITDFNKNKDNKFQTMEIHNLHLTLKEFNSDQIMYNLSVSYEPNDTLEEKKEILEKTFKVILEKQKKKSEDDEDIEDLEDLEEESLDDK